MEREKSRVIRQFIIEQIEKSPQDIVRLTINKFAISRQAVNRHIRTLIDRDMIRSLSSIRHLCSMYQKNYRKMWYGEIMSCHY
jgi:hypothetical protein